MRRRGRQHEGIESVGSDRGSGRQRTSKQQVGLRRGERHASSHNRDTSRCKAASKRGRTAPLFERRSRDNSRGQYAQGNAERGSSGSRRSSRPARQRGLFELVRPDEARGGLRGIVRISVPTAFLRQWINGHYLDLIDELWKQEDPRVLRSRSWCAAPRAHRPAARCRQPIGHHAHAGRVRRSAGAGWRRPGAARRAPARRRRPRAKRQSVLGSPLDAAIRSTPSSKAPPTASPSPRPGRSPKSLQRGALQPALHPCSVGLGKTHLLQAIAAEALRAEPAMRASSI